MDSSEFLYDQPVVLALTMRSAVNLLVDLLKRLIPWFSQPIRDGFEHSDFPEPLNYDLAVE